MSIKAISWAWELKISSVEKLVLLALCDCADNSTFECWPSQSKLSKKCSLSLSSIVRSLRSLEKMVLISKSSKAGSYGRKTSNQYMVNVGSTPVTQTIVTQTIVRETMVTQTHTPVTQTGTPCHSDLSTNEPSFNRQESSVRNLPDKKNILNKKYKDDAIAIIDWLNEKAGRTYRHTSANVNLIVNRLKSGATKHQCFWIISDRCNKWLGTDQEQYLRPTTIFNEEKFEGYFGRLPKKLIEQGEINE